MSSRKIAELGSMGKYQSDELLLEEDSPLVLKAQCPRIDERELLRREKCLHNLADAIEENGESLIKTIVSELEFTVKSARNREIDLAAAVLRQYKVDKTYSFDPSFSILNRRPIGTVSIVLPYNGILFAGSLAIGAAYIMGNPEIIVRCPSRAVASTLQYQALVEACLPGVKFVSGNGQQFINQSFTSSDINAVLVFGDDSWMSRYRSLARTTQTKVLFEGPGKDPFIVFSDGDLDQAVKGAVSSGITMNSGQSCSSPERFYVEAFAHNAFVEKLVRSVSKLKVGPPEAEDTDVGPIGSDRVNEKIKEQFADARRLGAKFLLGGEFIKSPGARYETCLPTVITNCHNKMKLLQDETFGPVIPIVIFDSQEQALQLAEDSRYGLNATVYSENELFARRLRKSHGRVFHNVSISSNIDIERRMFWGGFNSSGWVWEWRANNFCQREGPRSFMRELSLPLK